MVLRKRRVSQKQHLRLADLKPSTYNEETRSMEVVFSTGARVLRSSWFDGNFIEELDMDKKSVRLDRFKKGAPVLDSHNRFSLNAVLGVVTDARIEKGEGIATIRFSQRAGVQDIIDDIRAGIIKNVSVGYQTHKIREDKEQDGVRVFRAVDWEPTEVSFVTVPADAGAQARNEGDEHECEVEERGAEEQVAVTEPTPPSEPAPISDRNATVESGSENNTTAIIAEESPMDPAELKRLQEEAAKAERARASAIRAAVLKVGLAEDHAIRMIDAGATLEAAHAEIIEELHKRDSANNTASANVSVGADLTRESIRSGATAAVMHRIDRSVELDDNSKRFVHSSMVDIARDCLRIAGATGLDMMSKHQIVQEALRGVGYNSSSDFPIILENIITKTVQRGYDEAPRTWEPLARQVTVSDFKQVSRVHLGEFSQLEAVPEGGEYKHGKIGERGEKYSISKFGKKHAVTWEMLVNDDLSAMTALPAKLGKKARDLESDKAWDVLLLNTQVMAETGLALFHANHNNLNEGGAGAVSEATLTAIRAAMRLHKDLDGTAPLNIFPAHIFVPAAREVETMKLLRSITPNQSSQVNVFGQDQGFSMTPHVEPRLDGGTNPWFVSASVNSVDVLEVARLAGEESPMVQSRDGFDVDGVEFKIRHLFVAHAIDYRGLQRNNGV